MYFFFFSKTDDFIWGQWDRNRAVRWICHRHLRPSRSPAVQPPAPAPIPLLGKIASQSVRKEVMGPGILRVFLDQECNRFENNNKKRKKNMFNRKTKNWFVSWEERIENGRKNEGKTETMLAKSMPCLWKCRCCRAQPSTARKLVERKTSDSSEFIRKRKSKLDKRVKVFGKRGELE